MTSDKVKRSVLKKIIRYKLENDPKWARKHTSEAMPWAPSVSKHMKHMSNGEYVRAWKAVFKYLQQKNKHELAVLKAEAIKVGLVRPQDVADASVDMLSELV